MADSMENKTLASSYPVPLPNSFATQQSEVAPLVQATGNTQKMSKIARSRGRIAQKLLLLYFLPVSVLVIAGIGLPLLQWNLLGNSIRDFEAAQHFAEQTVALQKAASDTESLYRAYLLSREPTRLNGRKQMARATRDYRQALTPVEEYVSSRNIESLSDLLDEANNTFYQWNRSYIDAEMSSRPLAMPSRRSGTTPEFQANLSRVAFVSVLHNFAALTNAAQQERDRREPQANTAALLRQISAVLFPLGAFLLSALIGRSLAVSITRPLTELTRATEALEAGGFANFDDTGLTHAPDDELGELQQSFHRMARTIGQREAMLRAQNEALGGLNQRIESLLNATNDAILMLDRAGAFSVVNKRFAELFGIEPDVLIDQTFTQAAPLLLSRFNRRQEVRERLDALLADPQAIADENFEVGDVSPKILRLFSAPVRGEQVGDDAPEIIGRILVFRDVTRETLADRMKTEFVSTVSHELRTPLTAIKGYVDLMVSGQTGETNAVQTEFLTMVQESTKRLTALINDLLDISRIESGRVEIRQESVDYLPLVQQAVRMMQGEAATRHITLTVETKDSVTEAHPVYGDADRITQVLVNFLSNGIKYTPTGGAVTVNVEFTDDFVVTCVADTGIGIAPPDQNRLFQKFFRADNSTTRATGGTGLGLAITKALLEKLGGSVWVESEVGRGSKFWFTLPIVDDEANQAAPVGVMQRLVLNIAGDTTLLHRIGHALRMQGLVNAYAITPAEALRRAKGLHPDIVTLDLLASKLDGVAVLRTLRETPATDSLPTALLSVHTVHGQLEATDSVAYLPHSIMPSALANVLRELLPAHSRRENILVVGAAETQNLVRAALNSRGEGVRMQTAIGPDEAASRIAEVFPDVTIIDTTTVHAGLIAQRLRERRAGERVPMVLLLDDALLPHTFALPPLGTGGMPLGHIGGHLRRIIEDILSPAPAEPEENMIPSKQSVLVPPMVEVMPQNENNTHFVRWKGQHD